MDYVKSLDLFGQEVKEIPCITGKNPPSASTVGKVGMLYMDTDTGEVYKCTSIESGTYKWEPIADTYSKSEIDAMFGSYVNDIDALIGGES